MADASPPHILVLGAGFGGLTFCKSFDHPAASITLVDRQNHHLFQPLLYQVATAGLAPAEIAQPIRSILADKPNVTVLMDDAVAIDLKSRKVTLEKGGPVAYDVLVLALGGVTGYFGHPEWEATAPGLKTLEDAIRIRDNVLVAFERAETEADVRALDRLMTLVVVGGGPTGVEMAGALVELARHVLRRDFRRIDPARAHVILLEAGPRLLTHLPEDLSESARKQLEAMGVQVRTGTVVKNITPGRIDLADGTVIEAENVVWAAGVGAHPLTRQLGVELDKAGRVKVMPDLSLPGHPEVFAIGDMALVLDDAGKPVPGVSPAAMQMARHVARWVARDLEAGRGMGEGGARPAFKYWDKGTMATIGRSAAVAWIGPLKLHGLIAWMGWLFVHLLFLIGFRNRVAVVLQWIYSYFAYKRGARIITRPALSMMNKR